MIRAALIAAACLAPVGALAASCKGESLAGRWGAEIYGTGCWLDIDKGGDIKANCGKVDWGTIKVTGGLVVSPSCSVSGAIEMETYYSSDGDYYNYRFSVDGRYVEEAGVIFSIANTSGEDNGFVSLLFWRR